MHPLLLQIFKIAQMDGLSLSELARRSKMDRKTLYNMRRLKCGKYPYIRIHDLERLAKAIGMRIALKPDDMVGTPNGQAISHD